MFDIVLVRPEIPPNAGNVIRLAANTGARLHLVEPLGFSMDDRQLKRAGLDYREYASVRVHADWQACRAVLAGNRMFALTTRARHNIYDATFRERDVFVFGSETAGLPEELLNEFQPEARLRIPMRPGNRSLNLSNAVAVTVFEAWRQLRFPGGV
jgi:tRNA (cytidine/uridine-2'-O-)-methyltransferase